MATSPVPLNGVASPIVPMPGAGGASNGNIGAIPTISPTASPTQVAARNPYAMATTASGGVASGGPIAGGSAPVSAPISTSTTPTVNGLPPGSVQGNGVNWVNGSNSIIGDFSDTYGQGTGEAITSVLQNLGTSTDSAVQALINNTNLEAGQQYANIQAGQAASGITPNSSAASLAEGDFYSNVNSNLQSQVAGLESNEDNTLLSSLTNEGAAHGPDPTLLQSIGGDISGALGIGSSAASAASGLTSAFNPTADTGFLDTLGAL